MKGCASFCQRILGKTGIKPFTKCQYGTNFIWAIGMTSETHNEHRDTYYTFTQHTYSRNSVRWQLIKGFSWQRILFGTRVKVPLSNRLKETFKLTFHLFYFRI